MTFFVGFILRVTQIQQWLMSHFFFSTLLHQSEVWELPGANSRLLNTFTDSLKSSPLLHVEQDG